MTDPGPGATSSVATTLRATIAQLSQMGIARRNGDASRVIDATILLETARQLVAQPEIYSEPFLPVEQLLEKIEPGSAQLSESSQSLAWFLDRLALQLVTSVQPHPRLQHRLHHLIALFTCQCLLRDDLVLNLDAPLIQLLNNVLDHARLWDPGAGRLSARFLTCLDQFMLTLGEKLPRDASTLEAVQSEFEDYHRNLCERFEKIAKRLINTEASSADIEQTRDSVSSFIDRRLVDKPLPTDIAEFIRTQLVDDLQYLVINQGINCRQWQLWKRLLQVLSWCYTGACESTPLSAQNDYAWRQKLQTLLPPILEGLNSSYYEGFSNSERYDDFLQHLIRSFMQLLHYRPMPCIRFTALNPQAPRVETRIENSQDNALENLREQQWYRLRTEDGSLLRCCLILQQPRTDLLLFSGYGQTMTRYSYEDFGNALSLKLASPIADESVYPTCLRQVISQAKVALNQQASLRDDTRRREEQKKAAEAAEREAEILESRPAETEAPLAESEKGKFEQRLQQLQSGAWVKYQKSDEEYLRMKLAVKLAAMNKYIFTDRVGQKIAEFRREDLVQLMASNRLQILTTGKAFESSLEQVVRGLRKDT